ncbi:PLP-dependent aminotransferase family protein [Sorangium sp. So ce1000]|uniref:MocR-like pyridoxine biosynthesis transcription factor PdxR n=1 Tax=Sorangium sp. So ce1000 TaxID=3133325 RepID=UPI003F6479A0
MPWELALAVDPAAPQPIFLQIARALADDIRRGRLRAGAELPGSRALARSLSVHRNTVLAAYRELTAEGWIEASAARGTFVSAELPAPAPRGFTRRAAARAEVPARLGFDLGATSLRHVPLPPPGTLRMSGGLPDMRLVPTAALARAYRRALHAGSKRLLDYADPRGDERLRAALAAMLSAVRGLAAGPESVLVTRGSQMALDLVARALIAPGDAVAVESYGYRPAWEALRLAGARLIPLPVDAAGLSVDALSELAERERLRAVYVTPHHQYPTTAVLAPGRRIALLELCRARRIAVLEDDYDHEFHYDGRPVLPLASADTAGVVVYIGTLSKILAPGLRIGFVIAPVPLIERLALHRAFVDRQGDHAVERAVAELLEDGEVQRHAQRARRAYRARRDLLVASLRARLPDALDFRVPAGGMALWAKVDAAIDADAWAERALARKVAFSAGRRFAFDGKKRPFLRLGFAALDEREIGEAVERMVEAL